MLSRKPGFDPDVVAKAPSALRRTQEISLTPDQIASVTEAMSKLPLGGPEEETSKILMGHLSPSPSDAYGSYFGADGAMLTPHSVVVAYDADRAMAQAQLAHLSFFSKASQTTAQNKPLDTTDTTTLQASSRR